MDYAEAQAISLWCRPPTSSTPCCHQAAALARFHRRLWGFLPRHTRAHGTSPTRHNPSRPTYTRCCIPPDSICPPTTHRCPRDWRRRPRGLSTRRRAGCSRIRSARQRHGSTSTSTRRSPVNNTICNHAARLLPAQRPMAMLLPLHLH